MCELSAQCLVLISSQLIKVVIYVFMVSHEVSGNSELMLKLSITVAFKH